jgi:iron complex outermembrane recepter protein
MNKRFMPLMLAAPSLFAIATTAAAQEPAPPAPAPDTSTQSAAPSANVDTANPSEEIVVTARRKQESAQDVPLVVNAVTSQTLEKLNIRNFKDVQSLVPGLTLTPAADGLAPSTTLRGVDYNVNNSGSNATVQFYLNDAPIAAGFLFQSMYDIGQIEVLRGPQGTLRGIASPSGSMTVVTRKPDLQEIGGYVSATGNSIGGFNVNGALNVPVIKDVLAVRVAGLFNDDEGTRVRSINNRDHPFNHQRGERVSVRFDPFDSLDIIATYQHLLTRNHFYDQVESANLALGLPVVGTLITGKDREAVEDMWRPTRTNYNIWNLQGEWKFAGQKLNYVGALSKQNNRLMTRDDIGNAFGNNFGGNPISPTLNLQNYGQLTLSRSKQTSNELRLSSDQRLFGMVDYVVGGMINRLDAPTDLLIGVPLFASAPPTPANFFTILQIPVSLRNRTLERSAFANVTVHIGEATEIAGGVRHIHFNSKSTLAGASGDFKANVYSASIKHRFSPNIMAYAATGSSWRVGAGTNGIIISSSGNTVFTDPAFQALNAVTPEKSKSYEAGVKTDWLNHKLRLNATVFHQKFDNYIFSSSPILFQATTNGTTFNPSITRAGLSVGVPVTVNGVEGEFAFAPSRNFNISGNVSYALGKIKNGRVPCNGASLPVPPQQINFCTVTQRSGPAAPFSASVSSEYNHELSSSADAFLRGQLTYYGRSQNDPANTLDDVKAYGLVNLFLGIRAPNGKWEFSAYGKNIFNTYRVLSRDAVPRITTFATFAGGGALATNYRLINSTAPREFGITGTFSFGSR